jgi:uncharacterized protein YukE
MTVERDDAYERIAVALETIAERMEPVDQGVASTAEIYKGLLKEVVELIQDPHSADEDWTDMLQEIKAIVGLP